MTKQELTRAFRSAPRGTFVGYYYGFLWADRLANKDVDKVGKAAWALYTNGEATLVQIRSGAGCHYFAVKL